MAGGDATPSDNSRPDATSRSQDPASATRLDADLAAWQRAREAERRLALQIADYAIATWGWQLFKAGFRAFSTGSHSAESERGALSVFDPWFVFTWLPNPKDDAEDEEDEVDVPEDWPTAPLALSWLASGRAVTSAFEQAFVVTAAASPYSFLLVEAVWSGWFLEVRDLMSGRRFRVVDAEISMHARPDDILVSALLTLDGVSTFLGLAPYTLPSDWRTEALDIRRCYTEGKWLSRSELMGMDWEVRYDYREAYDCGPVHDLDADGDTCEPMLLRWTLCEPLATVCERLRPLCACGDDDAIELEHWPDGAPHLLMTWFEPDPAGQSVMPLMRSFLHIDEGALVADVPTLTLANRLSAEVATRLPAATLVESRSAVPTRVHARASLLPVPAKWLRRGRHGSRR